MSDKEWRPEGAPDLKQHFEGKKPEQEASEQIATKRELEKLIAERSNPTRNLEYLPNSLATSRLQDQQRRQREERISYIEDLFAKHRAKMRDDFNGNADDYLQKRPYKTMTDKELDDFYRQERNKDRGDRER